MVKKTRPRASRNAKPARGPHAPKILEADRKFHQLLNEWRKHVREEIALHQRINAALSSGRRDFHKHLHETIELHSRFVKQLKKL